MNTHEDIKTTAASRTHVPKQLEANAAALAELHGLLDELGTMLTPVLLPDHGAYAYPLRDGDGSEVSPVASALGSHFDQIAAANNKLRTIRDALDI